MFIVTDEPVGRKRFEGLSAMQDSLVYDIGAHTGEDTAFYLSRGFHVVSVEANPDLCEGLSTRFGDAVAEGRLQVVNKAVARERGSITFYQMKEQSTMLFDHHFPNTF